MNIPSFRAARVGVVGDVMLDRYWSGETRRISPEAPVPIVRVAEETLRPGGAANVAANLCALGASCLLLGAVGEDEAGRALRGLLGRMPGLTLRLAPCRGPTITKLRVLSRHQQLLRLDFEPEPEALAADLLPPFEAGLSEVDAVVLSDYGKGTLADPRPFIARSGGRPVVVDPKSRDFGRYRGATVLTPNLAEFEAAAGPWRSEGEMVEKAMALLKRHGIEALLITRAERGMTLVTGEGAHPIPARAREVFDVTGAGDTVVAWLAAGLAAGLGMLEAATLANAAAGIAVGKLGASPVTPGELALSLDEVILDEERLLLAVEGAKARGERIVMTNGCFDILHAGHVRFLNEAKSLGDRLVVAVNDDASVGRLKGPGRPIHPLARRMEVLAALGAVDWVVPFAEDTPERLICRVRPHLLVKGGDYRPEAIAGRRCAGEVRALRFWQGHSTTGILERLKEAP